MIELTNKLIAVTVPGDAYDFRVWDDYSRFKQNKDISNLVFKVNSSKELTYIELGNLTYSIVGTITKLGNFGFDCTDYVGKPFNGKYYEFLPSGMMRVASLNHSFPFGTKEESFISLLNSKGILLEQLNDQKLLILERCNT
jgi:hypothetical protein